MVLTRKWLELFFLVIIFLLSQGMPSNPNPSRSLQCAPDCTRGPFFSAQAVAQHRLRCSAWTAHVAAQAEKRTLDEEISGEDEDPAITRRKRQKLRQSKSLLKSKKVRATGSTTSREPNEMATPVASSSTLAGANDSPRLNDVSIIEAAVESQLDPDPETVTLDNAMPPFNERTTEVEPEPLVLTTAGRPIRATRGHLPARYRDILPQGAPATMSVASQADMVAPEPIVQQDSAPDAGLLPRITFFLRDRLQTPANIFGLWRDYSDRPSHDPDGEVGLEDLSNIPLQTDPGEDDDELSDTHVDSPLNPTQTLLTGWQNNGNSTKSNAEMDELARLLQRPEFCIDDLKGYNAQRANEKVTKADEDWAQNEFKDSFIETNIEIEVPSGDKDIPPQKFQIPQLLYRNPLSVIRAAFSDRLASSFHFTPFKLFQEVTDNKGKTSSKRVYTDLYNSDVFIEEHKKLRYAPTDDPDCKREKVVAALMCWSDATQLANFGTAKLWPIYTMFGNLSKYIRASPNSGAVHHLAYIPVIPDSVRTEISKFHVNWKTQSKEIMAHCNRELYHAVLRFLLNDEFVHAYKYGMVIKCFDGKERRVYPRFFTWSADYPEKVLLATIRDFGSYPCPRCLCPKSKLDQMGTHRDMKIRETPRVILRDKVKLARTWIYHKGDKIHANAVERVLKPTSSVPTMNAFLDRLGLDFDLARMLVVDLMHEFELGVWKALFTHLIRILYAAQPQHIEELDDRYRQMPTFGFDTIRAFTNNASEMKKLAARDFEDLLQCAIPVFEGLQLSTKNSYDSKLITLLYRTAEWHALAKLRMHTEDTLDYLQILTRQFGKLMREFRDLSSSLFTTYETNREMQARSRRLQQQMTGGSGAGQAHGRQQKALNLLTYKWHALPDYVPSICWFGPTDSTSTQTGELAHRVVKRLYGIGNKKKDPKQIGRRLRRVEWSKRVFDNRGIHTKRRQNQRVLNPENANEVLAAHHHIGRMSKQKHNLGSFIQKYRDDPAAKNFWPKLQDHLLGRLLNRQFDGDTHESFTDADRNHIRLKGGQFISLKTCRINYTTYDVRRDQDTINPSNHADVMMLSGEDHPGAHPYWYARVLGIYRATVLSSHPQMTSTQSGPQDMEFLWVRWLGIDPEHRSTSRDARLPKVGFVEESDPFAFGFLDPAQVIRGCHLMPAFKDGRTNKLLQTTQPTVARKQGETNDWEYFYVGVFVDRDMFMRYFPGGGVGHVANRKFFKDNSDQGSSSSDSDDDDLHSEQSESEDGGDRGSSNDDKSVEAADNDSDDDEDSWQSDNGYGSL